MNYISSKYYIYSIKCGQTTETPFTTNTGVPQGDCLSPLFFILYLAKAMNHEPHLQDHSYSMPKELGIPEPTEIQDHSYSLTKEKIHQISKETLTLSSQYADDCSYVFIANNKHMMEHTKATLPPRLKERQLECNESKTEEHEIKLKGDESWKKCKQLGSLLDTKEDIKRRKILSQQAIQKLQHIWQDRRTPTNTKIRIFNACVKPIFLYNAELWTLTKTQENQIDAYQRRLLRKILNIRWPQKISNEKLKHITKHDNWSKIISTARLRWLGHALRLPETTPARRALDEAERPTKHPQGGQKKTWLGNVKQQLTILKISWEKAKEISKDRKRWRSIVCEWRDRCEEESS